jgi:putative sigma-54 modulation protein
MPLQITARNVEISPEMRSLIEAKVDRFRKIVDEISVLDVIVIFQRGHYTVEVVVKAQRFAATGSETDSDLRAAIDRVMGKVDRQLHKQLDKMRTKKRQPREVRERRALTLTLPMLGEAAFEADEERRIVRTQRIATKPMSVQEAADVLEIEAGSFLVFENAATEQINIIFRREDGRFGLIEPS